MRLAIVRASTLVADPARLAPIERDDLATITGERRRIEWIRGRLAARRVLGDGASVVCDADGAPRVVGDGACVSLSHDGGWIAVAAVDVGRVGIDLCLRAHAERATGILRWLGVAGGAIDPVAQWAALEAALKLRRYGIETLRDRACRIELCADGDRLVVSGLGDPVTVDLRSAPTYVVAWCTEGEELDDEVSAERRPVVDLCARRAR